MHHLYLVLDSQCNPLAQAVLESPLGAELLQVRVLDGAVSKVTAYQELQLVGLDDKTPARGGVITQVDGDQLTIRPTAYLGEDSRENLRVNTNFSSVIYPVTGSWKGRQTIWGKDLSCGGMAFHSNATLVPNEVAEVVLPMTDPPLLLDIQILSALPTCTSAHLYSSKFLDLIPEEESMIRKAVFGIQISNAH
jgi:hypothetical protein